MSNEEINRERFRLAIEENIDSLFGMARRLTSSNAEAEDLVGDAVVKAWSAYNSLHDDTRFRPWIMKILHNCFVSGYRRKKARLKEVIYQPGTPFDSGEEISSLLENMSDEFLMWWGNPEKEYVNKLLGEEIAAAIERLPDEFRMVVILINIEGFTYDETARVLDIPSGTVRSRMKRGRTLLQKALWDMANEAGFKATKNKEIKI